MARTTATEPTPLCKTLGMAAVGGAVTATVASITSGTFDPQQLKYAAIGGSVAAASAYLKQSPIGHYFPPPQDPPKGPTGGK